MRFTSRGRAVALFFILQFTQPGEAKMLNIPEIGDHYKIITFEKNENPQNILIVYTKLDESCRLVKKEGKPLVDFYWLMDGKKYKPTHALIKDAVRKRLEITKFTDTEFVMRVNDLKDLKTPVANSDLTVKITGEKNNCKVSSFFPDDQRTGRSIIVDTIYSESKKTFVPPFRKLLAVTIRGTASDTSEAVERKFLLR